MDRTFWSHSKDVHVRSLSNFACVHDEQGRATTLAVDAKECLRHGIRCPFEGTFDCIEAVYQAGKYAAVTRGNVEDVRRAIHRLQSGQPCATGLAAKRAGSKSVMQKEYHLKLDPFRWDKRRSPQEEGASQARRVMKMAVELRARTDPQYAALLQKAMTDRFVWLHLEPRKGSRSYWGGSFSPKTHEWQGQNELGRILHEVARERLSAVSPASSASSAPSTLSSTPSIVSSAPSTASAAASAASSAASTVCASVTAPTASPATPSDCSTSNSGNAPTRTSADTATAC